MGYEITKLMNGALTSLLRALKLKKPKVVYTCLFGYSEYFSDWTYERPGDTDFICFTDDKTLTSKFWKIVYLDSGDIGPVKMAKNIKICAHQYLSSYDSSLYVDNTVKINWPVAKIFEFLKKDGSSLVCYKHPDRDCVYDEADVIIDLNLDDPAVVARQMEEYRKAGHPEHAGLIAGTVLLRRHNSPDVVEVMEDWLHEVERHSYRMQLSYDVVARRHGFAADFFPGNLNDGLMISWPVLVRNSRVPRDFRDDLYVSLNPDVRATGMEPREHYLKIGHDERRRYK
jgi:hypothetical protein